MDFIPFKVFIDKAVLADNKISEDLGNYYAIEILISHSSNMVIVSKEGLEKVDEAAIRLSAEGFLTRLENSEDEDEYIN